MMLQAPIFVLFVVGVLGGMITEDHPVVRDFIASLQNNVKIDWKKPPTSDTNSASEETCASWLAVCNPVYFKISKFLVGKYPPYPASRELVESKPNITAYFIPRVEKGVINIGDDDISLSVEESTSTIDSTTEGWQIGAQIFGGVTAGAGSAGVSISAGYSKSWSTGTSQTKGVSIHTTCKSGYDCRIETWTFHLRVSGHCQMRPVINCGGEMDPCSDDWTSTCSQFDKFRDKHCLTCNSVSRYPHEKCEVHTPILDQVGQPFIRLVRISEKIRSPEDETSEALDAPQGPRAVKLENGWYELENGEWYDPDDNTYYGKRGDKWYHKPDSPMPDLSLTYDPVSSGCEAVPCHRELAHLYFGNSFLRNECKIRRRWPNIPLSANMTLFQFQPKCGEVTRVLKLRPSDYHPVCRCLLEKENNAASCPDCKVDPCYRELLHIFGTVDNLREHCKRGKLSDNMIRSYALPELPHETVCGKVSTSVHFGRIHFDPVCKCLDKAAAGATDQKSSHSQSKRGLPRPNFPKPLAARPFAVGGGSGPVTGEAIRTRIARPSPAKKPKIEIEFLDKDPF